MNFAHLHLLLNHFPTIGFGIGLGLFCVALAAKSDHLKQASLVIFFVVSLLTIFVYLSGNAADEAIYDLPDVSSRLVQAHEDAALWAFVLIELTGAAALLGLWQFRRTQRTSNSNMAVVLILSVLTFALMARAANFGGEIRHSEIRATIATAGGDQADAPADEAAGITAENGEAVSEGDDQTGAAGGVEGDTPANGQDEGETLETAETTETAEITEEDPAAGPWYQSATIAAFVTDYVWVWPTLETLHFIGMCMLFGVALIINLRMMGMLETVPFEALHRLLPFGVMGFGINLVTGMLFFMGEPRRYITNPGFQWKMILLFIAGINVLYFALFDDVWDVKANVKAPLRAKVMSVVTLALWVGVMYFGRMLPFLGGGGG